MLGDKLRGLDILGTRRQFATSAKGDNFCDFLFALLHAEHVLKGVYSIRNIVKTPFQKGTEAILTELSPFKVYPFP